MRLSNVHGFVASPDINHENHILKFKEQMTSSQRMTTNENIELIKLQRLIKEKSNQVATMEAR